MVARLLIAAHGTRSAEGSATTHALVAAVASERPSISVSLCFLDVAEPSLPAALDALGSAHVVVVPLLLSSGYHVQSDIPAIVAGRPSVAVARHLGPDPAIISAVADRLAAADGAAGPAPVATALAAISSTRPAARDEVSVAASLLAVALDRPVSVLPLSGALDADVAALPAPVDVAVYLLAEGGFLSALRAAVGGRGVVAAPIGVHPALVSLVWSRYDEVVNGRPEVQ